LSNKYNVRPWESTSTLPSLVCLTDTIAPDDVAAPTDLTVTSVTRDLLMRAVPAASSATAVATASSFLWRRRRLSATVDSLTGTVSVFAAAISNRALPNVAVPFVA
jgi:hypothetical protein